MCKNSHILNSRKIKTFPLTFLSFWVGCFCLCAAYFFLVLIEPQEYAFRTVTIGFLVLIAFGFHMFVRKAWRDPFHPDILLSTGHLVQFVVPCMLFSTGFWNSVMLPHTYQVRCFFPETLFAVLLGQTFFNFIFCLKPPRERKIVSETKESAPVFIILLMIAVWFGRVVIIFENSYFHSISSEFVNSSILYSPLSILDNLGRIITAYVMLRLLKIKHSYKAIIGLSIYLAVEIFWNSFSGKRDGVFMVFLCIALSYFIVYKKIPKCCTLILIVILIVVFPFLQYFRESTVKYQNRNDISVKRCIEEALTKQKRHSFKFTSNLILDRLNDGQFLAGCLKSVPDSIPFLKGKTYLKIYSAFVPHIIYSDGTSSVVNYNRLIRPWVTWSSAPVTTIGEAYINFGWITIPVVFLVLGILYYFIDSVFQTNLSITEGAILIFFCVLIIRMVVNPAVSHISWIIKIMLLLLTYKVMNKSYYFSDNRRILN